MPNLPAIPTCSGLIGAGALVWVLAGRSLEKNPALATTLNPFGIQRSPYGEVVAMAMQGPIDKDSMEGVLGITPGERRIDTPIEPNEKPNEQSKTGAPPPQPQRVTLNPEKILRRTLAAMKRGAETRTNPRPLSEGMRHQLRKQAEDKLRFTYNFDPSHYANYNALHFFLSEPGIGQDADRTLPAKKLADETIAYCLAQEDDPRPALTAAAACSNVIYLMLADRHVNQPPRFTVAEMRQYLEKLDSALARYDLLAGRWDQESRWSLLSTHRFNEAQDRHMFIRRIRQDAETTIKRLESQPAFSPLKPNP